MSDIKRIAQNTLFLYFRMILIMGVTIYTSRVVLDKLGVDDYGLYNVVVGIVGMLSFINGTLSIGSMRFLTYELGREDESSLHQTFCTAFYTHLALALILTLFLETIGLWYVYEKMVVPTDRFNTVVWVYQISILTSAINITQVPYTSLIMAHERMGIYAYVSIFESIAKLLVVYLICLSSYDRLLVYAVLLAIVQISVAFLYRIYCVKRFKESRLQYLFNKVIFRGMMGFSGWNIMSNLSETLNLQGVIVLINLFFAPYVVAAQAIANQVSGAMMQFVNNFRTAINPQIIKLYASGDRNDSKKLTLDTTIYCFDLVLMLGLPAIVVMDKLMDLWLVEVPPYAVIFTQWIIVRQIVSTFSASFYIPMMAANKMKVNSMASVFSGIGVFIVLYILFKNGCGPIWIQYIGLFSALMFSVLIKPYILCKDIDYSFIEILKCYWTCIKVTLISCLLSIPFVIILDNTIFQSVIKVIITFIAVVISSYLMMEKRMREKCVSIVKTRFLNFIK
jgi:O-antigen/teichoic acid export membrane protein